MVLALDDGVRDLVADRLDLAIRAGPLPDSGLIARRLGELPAGVVAAPAYLQAHGVPGSLTDLAGHACLRYDEHVRTWPFGDGVPVPIGRGPAINSSLGQLQAARHGAGLALLADYLAEADLASGRLVRVLPAHRPRPMPVFAVHPYARHVPAKVVAAIAFFVESFAGLAAPAAPDTRVLV